MGVESDVGFWKWVAGTVASTFAGLFGYHKYMDGKISKKADKDDVDRSFKHIEKLYENAEQDRKLTRDLHDSAMKEIAQGQRQIIDALTRR
jgi:Mg2+ and Co2+ transporter CorA